MAKNNKVKKQINSTKVVRYQPTSRPVKQPGTPFSFWGFVFGGDKQDHDKRLSK